MANDQNNKTYTGAPYNFVPLQKEVERPYEAGENGALPKDLPRHNQLSDELLSGEITVSLRTVTEMIVDSGKKNFFRNAAGETAVPGSSFRGLVRNNMTILGLGAIGKCVEDYSMMFRQVATAKLAGGKLKEKYLDILGIKSVNWNKPGKSESVSMPKNVKAGYIVKDGSEYKLYFTEVNMISKEFGKINYYPLRETNIFKEVIKAERDGKVNPYKLLYSHGEGIIQNTLAYDSDTKTYGAINEMVQSKGYIPYAKKVSYSLKGKSEITAVGRPGVYEKEGYAISTGLMPNHNFRWMKKTLYIIPAMTAQCVTLDPKDIRSFQQDYEHKKRQLVYTNNTEPEETRKRKKEEYKKFFALPEKAQEPKPIFYIERGEGRYYLGFTPYLRIFYAHSIAEGIPEAHRRKGVTYDYVNTIMGFSDEETKISFKSRVSFEDLVKESGKDGRHKEIVLGSPKPSSFLDYLVQNDPNSIITYDEGGDGFQIRGIKQYWLREDTDQKVSEAKQKDTMASDLNPIASGAVFVGKVHFKNLRPEELGLLLWSIRLDENSEQNIGKAKPYGYGRIKVELKEVKLFDYAKMYRSETLDFSPFRPVKDKGAEYVQAYQDKMKGKYGKDIRELPAIRNFLLMKNPEILPKPEKIKYMELSDYKNRTTALETPEQVLGIERTANPVGTESGKAVERPVENKEKQKPETKSGKGKNGVVYQSGYYQGTGGSNKKQKHKPDGRDRRGSVQSLQDIGKLLKND